MSPNGISHLQARVTDGDFRTAWESLETDGEVLQKYGLQFRELGSAVSAVVACLGMQPEDNSNIVADQAKSGMPHSLHLSGIFIGNIRVLVRAQLILDEKAGCVLKMAVRSPILQVSQIVADCIK